MIWNDRINDQCGRCWGFDDERWICKWFFDGLCQSSLRWQWWLWLYTPEIDVETREMIFFRVYASDQNWRFIKDVTRWRPCPLQQHLRGQVAPEALGAWQVALKPQERRAWQYFTLCRAWLRMWMWMRRVDWVDEQLPIYIYIYVILVLRLKI